MVGFNVNLSQVTITWIGSLTWRSVLKKLIWLVWKDPPWLWVSLVAAQIGRLFGSDIIWTFVLVAFLLAHNFVCQGYWWWWFFLWCQNQHFQVVIKTRYQRLPRTLWTSACQLNAKPPCLGGGANQLLDCLPQWDHSWETTGSRQPQAALRCVPALWWDSAFVTV